MPLNLKFESFEKTIYSNKIPFDDNMKIHDYMKFTNSELLHICFIALDEFVKDKKKLPTAWNIED